MKTKKLYLTSPPLTSALFTPPRRAYQFMVASRNVLILDGSLACEPANFSSTAPRCLLRLVNNVYFLTLRRLCICVRLLRTNFQLFLSLLLFPLAYLPENKIIFYSLFLSHFFGLYVSAVDE